MSKMENELKSENENNNKEENDLIYSNDNKDKSNIKLDNELLSSIFNSPPHFEKNFENKELNKFKDEILIYLSERNQHYKSLINSFHDKIQENKKEYFEQMKLISENYGKILSSQAALNNKIEKISNIELFINKTNDQLITHEIRINNLASDHIKATQKYDKIYLDNLELPGYIGKFAKFKNCQAFFENIIKELDKVNQYKEKNNLDIKTYKEKLDGIIKSFHLLIKNNNETQMKYIKQLNDKCFKESKEMNEILGNRICDLRIENAKCSMDLVKKSNELNKEWKKVLEIKDNILNQVNDKLNHFKNIFYNNVNHFNIFQKEFEDFRTEINEVMTYYREVKSDITNNNINVNPNSNSYNNFGGCYISSALPLERKNWKYFPRKFSKKAKRKSKNNNDKKYFIKSISSLNENGYKTNENIIKVDFDNTSNNNNIISNINNNNNNNNIKVEENTSKEKELKKRNLGSSLRKEKTINSMEKYKYGSEFQTKKNINIFKDQQRMSRTVAKIEINSHDKISSFDRNKREIEKEKEKENFNINKKNTLNINNNSIQKILNNYTNSIITNSSISNKSQEKEKIISNKFKKNKRNSFQSNKGVQSEDIINNITNINIGNSNTINSSNENRSRYSTNSAVNVNKFVLNDNYLETNKVIKELASELEQSTNKKDNLASNKKIIEENFKVICNKISPLNLNKINCSGDNISLNENYNEIFQNQNMHNNLNMEEDFKTNTVSTEKTEEGKVVKANRNSNNICTININQNDYDSMNKKMDIFEKKLFDLESILKEKIFEVLSQFDNLQNIFFSSIVKNKNTNNFDNINISNSNIYKNLNIKPFSKINMNRSFSIDYMDNLATCRSNDDYYIKSHSVRKIAPIVEINPNNLQFSPSPAKTPTILSNKKSIEQNKKMGSKAVTNNFKDIKLVGKSENKENIKNINNLDYNDITQNRLFAKNGNFIGVTKWINLNRLVKNEKTKISNIPNKGGLLANNFDNN